jgi:hypothetical protein
MSVNHYPTISSPLDDAKLRVVSFGAGVQSTTMLLMAAEGLIGPMPDMAIFADTQDEPQRVRDHLALIQSMDLPFPIEIVTAGSIREQIMRWTRGDLKSANGRPPLFIRNADGKVGMTNRQCTQDWKIIPIERRVRDLVGIKKGSPGPKTPVVEQWIGISMDEAYRMKPSRKRWIYKQHPLIEADMNRRACIAFCQARGVNPPKSACRICPFHDDAQWLDLQASPEDFEAACEVDEALRSGFSVLRGTPFLHRSCKPLRQIDFAASQPDPVAWLGECDGMCGV